MRWGWKEGRERERSKHFFKKWVLMWVGESVGVSKEDGREKRGGDRVISR